MTVSEFFTEYFRLVNDEDLVQDLEAFLALLDSSQKETLASTVKTRIVTKYSEKISELTSRRDDSLEDLNDAIALYQAKSDDANAVVL